MLHPRFGGRPAYRGDPIARAKLLTNAEEAVLDLLALLELVNDPFHLRVERNRIAARALATRDARQRCEQTDPIPPEVKQRPAAGARRDIQTRLPKCRIVEQARTAFFALVRFSGQAAADVAEQAPRHARAAVSEADGPRVGQRQHELTFLDVVAITLRQRF